MEAKTLYWLQFADYIFELTSTTNISKSMSGAVPEKKSESGRVFSDNYVNENTAISLSGTMTNFMFRDDTIEESLKMLEKLQKEGSAFNLHWSGGHQILRDCVITSLSLSHFPTRGQVRGDDKTASSWAVSITFSQLRRVKSTQGVTAADEMFGIVDGTPKDLAGVLQNGQMLLDIQGIDEPHDVVIGGKNYVMTVRKSNRSEDLLLDVRFGSKADSQAAAFLRPRTTGVLKGEGEIFKSRTIISTMEWQGTLKLVKSTDKDVKVTRDTLGAGKAYQIVFEPRKAEQ